ncbi:MAG: purine-nucleoside phosphorylase [Clostridia bacterium]|nr:purine-nucleoside phosphorylase [Clostridia bacterium]
MTESLHIKPLDEILFGKTVLMPGDPLRSELIAKNFLENPVLVNGVRGVNGFTGFYKGVKVSVMASGMGMPSIGIYSYELYKNFDVQNIIRIGSAGAISKECKLRDVIAGIGACTDSNFGEQYSSGGTVAPVCDYSLLEVAKQAADEKGINLKIGSIFSSDIFYDDTRDQTAWAKMGCLCVEMEAAALYMTAMRLNKRALTLCTVSNLLWEPYDSLSADDCRASFDEMAVTALETAVRAETLPRLETRD